MVAIRSGSDNSESESEDEETANLCLMGGENTRKVMKLKS